jgi:hypothetical protein
MKSSRRLCRRGENLNTNKRHEKRQTKKKSKEKLKIRRLNTTPNTLNASSPPYIVIYYVSSLNHPISKSSTNFVCNLSSFGNELIKHEPREERDAMHEIQN